jgi:hypothetical protein
MTFDPHLQDYGIHVDDGIDRLQRPDLPLLGPFQYPVRNGAYGLRKDLVVVEILDMI